MIKVLIFLGGLAWAALFGAATVVAVTLAIYCLCTEFFCALLTVRDVWNKFWNK